ncbi:Tol-Pal system beta propeller repeat protein TolB [Alphaproteobacteria bacterium]|nr:Tol-Pal system beta propeller repeat protein TolB [Alphaproteobacteria bacterium]
MKKKLFLNLFIIFFSTNVFAALDITISQGKVEPTPIAITNFYEESEIISKNGEILRNIISKNLTNSGLFYTVDDSLYIQKGNLVEKVPRFEDWKIINAQFLLSADIKKVDNTYSVRLRLYDVLAAQEIKAVKMSIPNINLLRRLGHKISDLVYERITGESGYFDTRIVYISEVGPLKQRVKRLAIMDQDGHPDSHQFLTNGKNLVLTPRFAPNNQIITYMEYEKDLPRVYIYNLKTGVREIVGDFPGMTFAPRFSPDSQSIVMSFSDPKTANTEVYLMDLNTRTVKRLTNDPGIDTSPSFSPDGKKIVFNSDRGGYPQLYTMDSDGGNIKRISRGKGVYGNPVWSPRGDQIAFTKLTQGSFHIGIMDTLGLNERVIVKDFSLESPAWSPNGRYLIFYRQQRSKEDGTGGETSIHFIDITGFNERLIPTPRDGSDPSWSPLL